jgi:hypothetical protein
MPREAPVTIAVLLVLLVIFSPYCDKARLHIDVLRIVISSLRDG